MPKLGLCLFWKCSPFGAENAFLGHSIWFLEVASVQFFQVWCVFCQDKFLVSGPLSSIPTIFGIRTARFKFLVLEPLLSIPSNFWCSELLPSNCQNCFPQFPQFLVSGLLPSNFWCLNRSCQSSNFRCQNCSFQIFGLRTAPLNPFKIWVFRTAFKLLELFSSIPTILVSGLLPSNFWCQNCSCQSSNYRCQNCSFQIFGLRTAPLNPLKFLISRLLPSIFGARSPFVLLASEHGSFSNLLFQLRSFSPSFLVF